MASPTTPPTTSQTHFPFLSLPPEIRVQIYAYLLVPSSFHTLPVSGKPLTRDHPLDSIRLPTTINTSNGPITDILPVPQASYYSAQAFNSTLSTLSSAFPFLYTCRLLRAEALSTFDNHFLPLPTINSLYAFLRAMGRDRRMSLRRLQFVYHPASDRMSGMAKVRDMELTRRCIRLVARECRALRRFVVRLDEGFLKWHFGLCWDRDWEVRKQSALQYGLNVVAGFRELRTVKGVSEVSFLPAQGSCSFTERCWKEVEGLEAEMMTERQIGTKKVSGEDTKDGREKEDTDRTEIC